ncbi:acyl-CoA N-acyltransferase [Xylogone sp. PMI_703]|nr:acyl-CoA N-acyltransferase [Xylogone sp. PMI_703]
MHPPVVFNPSTHSHLLPSFVRIHSECITNDNAIATFVPPLDSAVMSNWWSDRFKECTDGLRLIVIQTVSDPSTGEEDLAGCVSLDMHSTQTVPFRGYVEKLLVSLRYRRLGIARRMMERLEGAAMENGKTLLVLDAVEGGPAESMYPKWGYIELGTIPNHSVSPDGTLKGSVLFYKHLK